MKRKFKCMGCGHIFEAKQPWEFTPIQGAVDCPKCLFSYSKFLNWEEWKHFWLDDFGNLRKY